MQHINRVILTGNLTRDPEVVTTAAGMTICKLGIAVNGRRKAPNGTWEDKPNFFDVTVFGAQGDNAAKYLEKGRPVAIDGRLDWQSWETSDGQKRSKVQVIADQVQYLSSGDTDRQPTAPAAGDDFRSPAAAAGADLDDIPF
jgi:single-strand DNA-binding protein